MMNYREVEISGKISIESTALARRQHRDGQSLRIIQYLGLVFLPLSLGTVSSQTEFQHSRSIQWLMIAKSFFGMNFFGVQRQSDSAQPLFAVAHTWWWALAFSIPLTVIVLAVTWAVTHWSYRTDERRRASDLSEIEKMLSGSDASS